MAATSCRQELLAACEEIGPVVSLRRVATDKTKGTTTKPRGFAFVEFLDDETALSACRNLRVGLARRHTPTATRNDDNEDDEEQRPVGVEAATHAASLLAPGARPSAAVTAYLAGMSRRQVKEMVVALGREEDAGIVEWARREYAGLDTLMEQARVVLDVAASSRGAAARTAKGSRKRGTGDREAREQPAKVRRMEDGRPVPGGVQRS